MRRLLILSVALLLASSSMGLTLAQGNGPGRAPQDAGQPDERGPSQERAQQAEGRGPPQDRGQPQEEGRPEGTGRPTDKETRTPPVAVGSFEEMPEGWVNGSFLSLRYDDRGIHEVSSRGVPLFGLEVEESREGPVEARTQGSSLRLDSPAFRARIHDNPGAVTRVDAPGLIRVAFAPEARLALHEGDRVEFSVEGRTGHLTGRGLAVDEGVVSSEGEVLVFLDAPRGAFDAHRKDLGQAIAKGHLGLEGTFNLAGDQVADEVVSYGNVTLQTLRAERGNLTVEVEGHGLEGRVIALNVDARVVGAQRAEDLVVHFDHEPIRAASNLTDVLDPDDDGLHPEYYLVFDPATESFQLLVSIPHYSVHVLSVLTLVEEVAPSVLVGVLLGVGLLVPGAAFLLRRPRRE